jgi:hypothetical protein
MAHLPTKPLNVVADNGSLAAGRDIRDSTVTIGLDEESVGRVIVDANRPMAEHLAQLTGWSPAAVVDYVHARSGDSVRR